MSEKLALNRSQAQRWSFAYGKAAVLALPLDRFG